MSMVEPSSLLKLLVQAADAYERALNPSLRAGLGTDLRPRTTRYSGIWHRADLG